MTILSLKKKFLGRVHFRLCMRIVFVVSYSLPMSLYGAAQISLRQLHNNLLNLSNKLPKVQAPSSMPSSNNAPSKPQPPPSAPAPARAPNEQLRKGLQKFYNDLSISSIRLPTNKRPAVTPQEEIPRGTLTPSEEQEARSFVDFRTYLLELRERISSWLKK